MPDNVTHGYGNFRGPSQHAPSAWSAGPPGVPDLKLVKEDVFGLLVTGSRTWLEIGLVQFDLGQALRRWRDALQVHHGHCGQGPDQIADEWAQANGVAFQRWSAEWKTGRDAGYRRNDAMCAHVNGLKHGVVFAYIDACAKATCPKRGLHGSHGTMQCAMRAKEIGLTVVVRHTAWPGAAGWAAYLQGETPTPPTD